MWAPGVQGPWTAFTSVCDWQRSDLRLKTFSKWKLSHGFFTEWIFCVSTNWDFSFMTCDLSHEITSRDSLATLLSVCLFSSTCWQGLKHRLPRAPTRLGGAGTLLWPKWEEVGLERVCSNDETGHLHRMKMQGCKFCPRELKRGTAWWMPVGQGVGEVQKRQYWLRYNLLLSFCFQHLLWPDGVQWSLWPTEPRKE